ncbi:MAG TPA: hypothetical protein VFO40_11970 [Chthoniobacterales bacterium]|nr:hypothetical protein [Chthoniobacterales bacterium]
MNRWIPTRHRISKGRHGFCGMVTPRPRGVTNLDQVPEKGALVVIGYPKLGGGTGGYARYIAICPSDWRFGVTIDSAKESPLPKAASPLRWDEQAGMRVRK